MVRVEQILYRDIDEPQKYNFFLMRQCVCSKTWKTIGVQICAESPKIMKSFRYTQPITNVPDNQMVILYSVD